MSPWVPSLRWARWHWPAASGACFSALASLDGSLGNWLGAAPLWAFGAGAGAGLLLGVASGAIAFAVRAQPLYVAILPWVAVSTLAAFHLASELGVTARLDGEYRSLALLALGASLAVAAFGSALGALLQPHRGHPNGWLLGRSVGLRGALATLLLLAAAATAYLDRTVETTAYPVAHDALRSAGLVCVVAAVWSLGAVRLPRPEWINATLVVAFLSTFTLTPRAKKELAHLVSRPYSALALGVVQSATDFDRDSFSGFFGSGDCAPFSAAIHPGAMEVPGNGVDDNCRRGDAPQQKAEPAHTVPVPTTPAPLNVVLVTVDTLAAGRMSLYGHRRDTTPELERWANDAVSFERAYSSGGWTSLAISSLFRGVYPRRLRWTRLIETNQLSLLRVSDPIPRRETMKTSFGMPLDDPREPLGYWLQRRGMYTAAVANDRQSEFLDPRFLGKGFDRFVDIDQTVSEKANDADVTDVAIQTLEALPRDRPFFLWVHYFGPHKPDERHEGIPDFGDSPGARYDHEVAYADREVRRFLSAVEGDRRAQATAIFVTADHGEQIRGDWRGHGGDLHEASIRIPLLVKLPGVAPARVRTPVSLVDLFPTILEVTETPGPSSDGVPLTQTMAHATRNRVLISETWRFNAKGAITNDRVAAFDGEYKLERDNLRDVVSLHSQRRSKRKSSPAPRGVAQLEERLETYLEENGVVDMHD